MSLEGPGGQSGLSGLGGGEAGGEMSAPVTLSSSSIVAAVVDKVPIEVEKHALVPVRLVTS